MQNALLNYSYIEKIISSKQFRSLQDKTQLFYSSPKRQVRTRLTHTIEVKVIAYNIGRKINHQLEKYNNKLKENEKQLKKELLNLDLIDAIALAHDIGHTPFGHIGERTIDEIVSKQDRLGGLINNCNEYQMRFKHNINSMRILEELGVQDWRIIDGSLCHTRIFYKNDDISYQEDPYTPFDEGQSKIKKFLYKEHNISISNIKKEKHFSLTLEGQVVAIADEIAQRVADISDGLESRYLEKIKEILSIEEEIKTRPSLEIFLQKMFTEDVVVNTIKNIQAYPQIRTTNSGISHVVYYNEIACFSESVKAKNDQLEDYIKIIMAQSESVRESDSRSKYIIRQLYKAYLNDVSLLSDEFIDDYFGQIINKKAFLSAIIAIENSKNQDESNLYLNRSLETFRKIQGQKWRIDNSKLPQNTKSKIKMDLVTDYFKILMKNKQKNTITELNYLLDEYLIKIGFYIAGLTNSEAFTAYNRIYGH